MSNKELAVKRLTDYVSFRYVQETNDKFNEEPYTYEVTKVELLISGSPASNALSNSTSISATKLLQGVEKSYDKGKKLLDESETPNNQELLEETRFRIADTDNNGRELSEQQREYFNGSKVTDGSGRLLEVYHSSPEQFTIFKSAYIGKNGTSLGQGFYFTSEESYSKGYGQNTITAYLNIKKPLSSEKMTISKADCKRFIDALDKYDTEHSKWR